MQSAVAYSSSLLSLMLELTMCALCLLYLALCLFFFFFKERQCWELNLAFTHTGQHFIAEVFLLCPVALFLGSEHGRKRA